MMPHAPSQGNLGTLDPSRSKPNLPSAPSAENLPQRFLTGLRAAIAAEPRALIDSLIGLLGKADDKQRAALRDLADDLLGEWLGEQIADLILDQKQPPSGSHSAAQHDQVRIEAHWHRFWQRHPNKVGHGDARKLFFALPWSDQFEQEFFEGHERCCLAPKWQRGGATEPFWWLKKKGWEDRPQGSDGKPIVGDSERRRLMLEARARAANPAVKLYASTLPKVAAVPETRSAAEILAAAGIDPRCMSEHAEGIGFEEARLRRVAECVAFLSQTGLPNGPRRREAERLKQFTADPRSIDEIMQGPFTIPANAETKASA
jgi:hypothetical protein